ncbi:MAG TPA: Rrf2 family transcriptional regulator [Pararhizobium sp.]|nr:Rrf2 family transcriptional regulator [Pararhizobium sp.]
MRLNLGTDYGLRVLMYLLARPGERAQIDTMAAAFSISAHHLTKVVQRLSHAGFVDTYRGRAGGVVLARAPEAINLGDVVRSLEADFALVECFSESGNACCLSPACRLRGIIGEALGAFIDTFSKYTLADLEIADLKRLLAFQLLPEPAERPA